jgi:ribonuclease-3
VIGAIYLDGGLESATQFILRVFTEVFGELKVIPYLDNPKGVLLEMLQSESPEPPQYALETVSGPDHDRVFECSVRYQGRELGRGRGKSKKEAESQAAVNALSKMNKSSV